jgi:hypothetical protein
VWALPCVHVGGVGDEAVSLARVRALAVLGLLVVLAAVAAGWAIAKDSETGPAAGQAPCVRSTAPFTAAVPRSAEAVRLNVYNATSRIGLANEVADELRALGFRVGKVGNDPQNQTVATVAQIRYGPRGAGAAQFLRAQIPGADAKVDTRSTAEIDVVLGMAYERLATGTELAAERKRLGAPTRPADLC